MRTKSHCLSQDLYSVLFWTVVSIPEFSFFLFLFRFCCAIFYFCSSSVFSNCDMFFFALRFLLLLFALAQHLPVVVLSLSWFWPLSFYCPISLHFITFVFSCVLSLAHFLFPPSPPPPPPPPPPLPPHPPPPPPPLSLSLFFSRLFANFFFSFCLSVFNSIFVSYRFFLRWVPDVLLFSVALFSFCFFLSHQIRFLLLFFSFIHYFLLLAPVGFLQAYFFCFSSPLSTFFCSLSFGLISYFYIFLLSDSFSISAAIDHSLSLPPSLNLILSVLIFNAR